MSDRINPSWVVLRSIETPEGDRCVDIFRRADNTFGFEEFRRDPEDLGQWTPVSFYSGQEFNSFFQARTEASHRVGWLNPDATKSRGD